MAAFSKKAKVIREKNGSTLISECSLATGMLEKMIGLLSRDSLASNEAMWINNSTSIHTFFMKFPIDVAFLDRHGKILAIYHSMPAWRHSAIHFFAKGALELRAGVLKEVGVQEGEVLQLCPIN